MNQQAKIAEEIARKAHEGQFRNDGVTPYITHPESVANQFSNSYIKAVAWLHDVLEDTVYTKEDLIREGLDSSIVDSVVAITHRPNQSYLDYILTVKENPYARAVKVEDIKHNLKTTTRKDKVDKYNMALYLLCKTD